MAAFSTWTAENWFNLVQSVGVIGSLLMAAGAANREAKAREIENILTLSEHHRELWQDVAKRPDLARVLRSDEAVLQSKITIAEEEFINLVTVHFQTGWRIAAAGGITSLGELALDAKAFFTLPLPRAVWEKTKNLRNKGFVQFVERALK